MKSTARAFACAAVLRDILERAYGHRFLWVPIEVGICEDVLNDEMEKEMKPSTNIEIKGSIHEVKGAIKETAGKVTNNPELEAKGKAEHNLGKVEKRVGQIEKVLEK